MRSSSDSNNDNYSFRFGNFSEPDRDYLLGNDILNDRIYFQVEAPEESCQLFTESKNQPGQQEFNQMEHYLLQPETTQDKMYNCLQLTPNIEQTSRKGYPSETRDQKLKRYRNKKLKRVWNKKVSYICRQSVAQQRPRIKGRFVTKNIATKNTKGSKIMNNQIHQQKSGFDSLDP